MGLADYHRMRRFDRTPEPRGEVVRAAPHGARSFVIQLHHASVRHYDFRLEVDGVLRSWSVPKGPSLRPGEKRLAVEVEDHPLDYGDFSGIIPEGQYGAGHVAIFDHGTWTPDGDPADGIERGKLEFELHGERLHGRWTLVRTRRDARKPHWLLIKRTDEHAGDLEADDLLAGIPEPPRDDVGASVARGRRIRAAHSKRSAGRDDAEVEDARGRDAAATSRARGPRASDDADPDAPARARKADTRGRAASDAPAKTARGAARRARDASSPDRRDALREAARALSNGRRIAAPDFEEPMLTIAADRAPAGDDWLHEWKWDGYRVIALIDGAPRLYSRNGLDWTARVPEITRALASLGVGCELDGELIAVDANGVSTFNGLQQALKDGDTSQLRYCVFDLMSLDGFDLRDAPLVERKALLQQLLDGADARLFYSTHVQGQGPALFAEASRRGMEGIISKRADSAYASGRSKDWLKVKAVETRDFIVVGYSDPKGSRQGLGALLLAQRSGGALTFAGRVGSGLGGQLLRDLPRRLEKLAVDTPPVDLPGHLPRSYGRVQWVRPELVVEVIFRGWSKEGLLRQATFHRLRTDKPADEDTTGDRPGRDPRAPAAKAMERAQDGATSPGPRPNGAASKHASTSSASSKNTAPKRTASKSASLKSTSSNSTPAKSGRAPRTASKPGAKAATPTASARARNVDADNGRLPTLSSPERVVYPDAGYTKRQVWDYHLAAAERLLPELRGRLLSIVRCPDGIDGPRFFQKHAGRGFGDAVHRHAITEADGKRAEYFYIDDLAGLMQLVQMNAIEFHPWGSTIDDLERPDRIVFDLDPDEGIGWTQVKAAAVEVRDRLAEIGLDSYPKLTGGKGVHVVVPLAPEADWERVRAFCEAFASVMAAQAPQRYVATMSKARREGRIFIDWLRNGRGATAIASWSLRARAGAPAAVPLTWESLKRVRRAARWTLADALGQPLPDAIDAIARKRQTLPV